MHHKISPNFIPIALMFSLGLVMPFLWPDLLSSRGFELDHHDDWPQSLVVLHVASDLLIGLAYAAIASILAFIVYQNKKHLPFNWVLLSFGLFILACGLTHIMHVVVRSTPVYDLDAYFKTLTAVVSLATAFALPPLIPRVRAVLRAGEQLEDNQQELNLKNTQLQDAVTRSDFHVMLSNLLQTVNDPLQVAEQALAQLGPMLHAEQILAMFIQDDHARLWSVWGRLRADTQKRMDGVSTPLSKLPIIQQVITTGQRIYLDDYNSHPLALPVQGPPIAVAFKPIKDAQGRVVATLNFTRPASLPWKEQEKELMSGAANTIGLALSRTELQLADKTRAAELQQLFNLNQALLDISRLTDQEDVPWEVARKVALRIKDTLELDWVGLGVQTGETVQPHLLWHSSRATGLLTAETLPSIPRGDSLVWRAIDLAQPVYVDDLSQETGAHPTFLPAEAKSAVVVPVTDLHSGDALLILANRMGEHSGWTPGEQDLFESAGRTVRLALQRLEHVRSMEQAALRDVLTGLKNRRAFEEDLGEELSRSGRHHHPVGVVMMDLDGLKQVNDTQGHGAGDRLLKVFGLQLKAQMRLGDGCYRLGGDEFAVILPHTPLNSQENILSRVQEVMASVSQGGFPDAGVSAGVAFCPEEGSSAADLMRLADERLYSMKERHRQGLK